MKQDHVTALVSGANRGLGRRIAAELLARGAKVYAGAPWSPSWHSTDCSRASQRFLPTTCHGL
jgi:NAD(P)-dependent dehydrogenase (short-subunit alcohol dehydrogenase family)